MNDKEQLIRKLSGAQFAALEMQLYLDTHKNDTSALKSMQDYVNETAKLRKEYQEKFGPITADDIFGNTEYEWLCAPWPWENENEEEK